MNNNNPGGRILIVDADRNDAARLGVLLESDGYQIQFARNGEAALWSVTRQVPSLVLIDPDLPGIDGIATCRALISASKAIALPVIFISEKTTCAEKIAAFDAGAVDFINRPFDEREVLTRIKTHVATVQAARRVLRRYLARAPRGHEISGPAEILIVDDTPESLQLLSAVLADAGYAVREALSGELAIWSAMRRPPDLILLDIQMPGMDGYEVCRNLKRNPNTADVPVIFLSSLDHFTAKETGFEAGAIDYITKPFAEEIVLARVRARLRHSAAIRMTTSAPPTSVPSSEFELSDLIESIDRPALLAEPNRMIVQVNRALQEKCGISVEQVLGTYLEEWAVWPTTGMTEDGHTEIRLPWADRERAVRVFTARLEDEDCTLCYYLLVVPNIQTPPTSACLAAPEVELLRESELRQAIADREFGLRFQPIVDLQSGLWVGAEAHLHWTSGGGISRDDFLQLAEQTGDIVRLGAWAFESLCGKMAAWRDQLPAGFTLAIRLTSLEFWQDGLVDRMQRSLVPHKLDPKSLGLVITAQVLEDDPAQAESILHRLNALGYRLVIEELDERLALALLRQWPVEAIRTAPGLFSASRLADDLAPHLEAMVNLARRQRLRLIAQGLDNATSEMLARAAGFRLAQGQHVAQALEEDDLLASLRSHT